MTLRIRGTGKGGYNSEEKSTFSIRLIITGRETGSMAPEMGKRKGIREEPQDIGEKRSIISTRARRAGEEAFQRPKLEDQTKGRRMSRRVDSREALSKQKARLRGAPMDKGNSICLPSWLMMEILCSLFQSSEDEQLKKKGHSLLQ